MVSAAAGDEDRERVQERKATDDDDDCAICLEDLGRSVLGGPSEEEARCVLPCSHVFHSACVSML